MSNYINHRLPMGRLSPFVSFDAATGVNFWRDPMWGQRPSIFIRSTTLHLMVRDLSINMNSPLEFWTDKTMITNLILQNPTFDNFRFLSLNKRERQFTYMAISELSIQFSKMRIDHNSAIITISVNNQIRHNLDTYHTNNSHLIQKLHHQNKISNNMQKKLKIANIIFGIKDTMTDFMFKELMDTLNEITN